MRGGAALLAIASLAGVVKDLVVDHRWVMYAIFIGLTLGGVPLVWRLIGAQRTTSTWAGAVAGLAGMILITLAQMQGGGAADRDSFGYLLFAGIAGASAMILPGISGGYLLLLLGVYVPILAAVDTMKTALQGSSSTSCCRWASRSSCRWASASSSVSSPSATCCASCWSVFGSPPSASCSGCCSVRWWACGRSRREYHLRPETSSRDRPSWSTARGG